MTTSDRPARGHARKVYVAGHRGMVGSAIVRALQRRGYGNVVARDRSELDLTSQAATQAFLDAQSPDVVVVAAGKVGGIHANETYPGQFIYENLMIEANVVHAAWRAGVKDLLFLGSSCIYPRLAPQPMTEEALLTGPLEPTNEPYAVAKIAGLKLCDAYNRQYGTSYRTVMPTNLYGPGDNYHPEDSHVIPGLIRRFHEAREGGRPSVTIWGSGRPRREFLYVDDLAEAVAHLLEVDAETFSRHAPESHINVGCGEDITIRELAEHIARVVGFQGRIEHDLTMPDGAPRKLLDIGRIRALGWSPRTTLEEGLPRAYEDFLTSARR